MEQNLKIALLVVMMLVLSSAVLAEAGLSFGSVSVKSTAQVAAGKKAEFKLLVFNAHEDQDLYVSAGAQHPEGWSVSINPKDFVLPYRAVGDREREEGFEFLATSSGDVKARPVWIDVNVPEDAEPGIYEVRIRLDARKESSSIAMSQSRTYSFKVEVTGQVLRTEEPEEEQKGSRPSPHPEEEEAKPPVTREPEKVPAQPRGSNELRAPVEEQINDLTGMLISSPLITPLALAAVVVVFLLLRIFKKI